MGQIFFLRLAELFGLCLLFGLNDKFNNGTERFLNLTIQMAISVEKIKMPHLFPSHHPSIHTIWFEAISVE
jgi:hypothetical protein